ncbi:thioredoxin domain-containing protein [Xenococcus sp. PCC 7305]|uniref:thioredoxin domain-containing protein n=1 Tax=Xenococcus sp. PCC 7305 TaxID=102125 RepID=UPI000316EE64|nr:thioredoxin domain-containing protein [Xenococcus sp. PCC 7305]
MLIAIICTLSLSFASPALAFGTSPLSGLITLKALAQDAVPYPTAITNGKPTLLEFYADWCTTCQGMSGTIQTLEAKYGDRVNLVMLDIDDPQWDKLVQRYRVTGIPQYTFLDESQGTVDTLVGKIPQSIMERFFKQLVS